MSAPAKGPAAAAPTPPIPFPAPLPAIKHPPWPTFSLRRAPPSASAWCSSPAPRRPPRSWRRSGRHTCPSRCAPSGAGAGLGSRGLGQARSRHQRTRQHRQLWVGGPARPWGCAARREAMISCFSSAPRPRRRLAGQLGADRCRGAPPAAPHSAPPCRRRSPPPARRPRPQNPFGAAKPREAVIAEKLGKTEEEVLKEEVSKEKLHVSRRAQGGPPPPPGSRAADGRSVSI